MKNIGMAVMLLACIAMASNANAVGQNEAAETATQILHAYKAKNWAKLAEFSTGRNRQMFQNLTARSDNEKSFTSGWRWQAVNNWNGKISEVRYTTYKANDGWTTYSAYAKFGASGDECFVVAMELGVKKWYLEDINSPDCSDFNSYSKTSEIVASTVTERKEKKANIDSQGADDKAKNDAYQQYIAAYNKLTQLMSQGKGDTPQAQRAFKNYTYEKQRYENILKENEAKKSRPEDAKNEPTNKKSEPKADNSSGHAANSKQEAYKKYIAAYKKLMRMVAEKPIVGPPEMKKVSDTYHQIRNEYNRIQDRNSNKGRRAYQGYIAALNRLNSMALKVTFTGPPALKKAQEDYQRARAEYNDLIRR